jgi:putative ABC transport system ATP-binding protein
VRALDGVDLDIHADDFLAVVGASGSGKSTLLNLLAGLDSPTDGSIEVEGSPFASMSRRDLSTYRALKIGMVFQSFHLISQRTALQNVELALYFTPTSRSERRRQAQNILHRLGLGDRLNHKPADLSGGEQQRVALARALAKQPQMLFADEPTGNLDQDNAHLIANLLNELNQQGLTIVLVTHNRDLAERCARKMIRLEYGKRIDPTTTTSGMEINS